MRPQLAPLGIFIGKHWLFGHLSLSSLAKLRNVTDAQSTVMSMGILHAYPCR